MIFIHGFLGHAFEFKPYLEYFENKVRWISISILGLEKKFPKPKDLNEITPKMFIDLIVDFVTRILKFKRIILVGHSFGAILGQAFVYHHPDLIAGVNFNWNSNIPVHLGFLAYTNSR